MLFKFLLNKKLFLALYSLVLFSFAYVTIDLQVLKEYKFDECINHFSTRNRFGIRASENKVIYVIGHAYGSHNTNEKVYRRMLSVCFQRTIGLRTPPLF